MVGVEGEWIWLDLGRGVGGEYDQNIMHGISKNGEKY